MSDTSTLLHARISVRFSFSILPPGRTREVQSCVYCDALGSQHGGSSSALAFLSNNSFFLFTQGTDRAFRQVPQRQLPDCHPNQSQNFYIYSLKHPPNMPILSLIQNNF